MIVSESQPPPGGAWQAQAAVALGCARSAGAYLRSQFGTASPRRYQGDHDVQLAADVEAQRRIVTGLTERFPGYGVLAEEGPVRRWPDAEHVWLVDPLDGTNNFGYGIAHCAISISLFRRRRPVLALVVDPLLRREFVAVEPPSGERPAAPPGPCVPLRRSTISLVTNYSAAGRVWGDRMSEALSGKCKRVTSLWAPALDLALVSCGQLDGMICHEGDLLDVGGGTLLVRAAGGHVLDLSGAPFQAHGSMYRRPVSFVAARDERLARELLEYATAVEG
ncbi:inositol monophosphatase family protein [Actinomadura violacea]|uniref:Inositol monophosphatase n=1 Tax=Actinomadura violacea TaxID=2819934 RepID=A0ABS3RI98_9ACTN|nr:inositol monophosphatase [Actinomadura violacea]MBO2456454.1 inositol monophosphatase [Actinomadura violacea]